MIQKGGSDIEAVAPRRNISESTVVGGKVHQMSDGKRKNAAPASGSEKASASIPPYSNINSGAGNNHRRTFGH